MKLNNTLLKRKVVSRKEAFFKGYFTFVFTYTLRKGSFLFEFLGLKELLSVLPIGY